MILFWSFMIISVLDINIIYGTICKYDHVWYNSFMSWFFISLSITRLSVAISSHGKMIWKSHGNSHGISPILETTFRVAGCGETLLASFARCGLEMCPKAPPGRNCKITWTRPYEEGSVLRRSFVKKDPKKGPNVSQSQMVDQWSSVIIRFLMNIFGFFLVAICTPMLITSGQTNIYS